MQTKSGKPLQVIIAGLSLSGKNQRRKAIQKHFPFLNSVLESGRLLRDRSSVEDELGAILKDYLSKGEHVPDKILNQLFRDEYHSLRNKNLLLDGFFRKSPQVKHHLSVMEGSDVDLVAIIVDTSLEVCRDRVEGSKKDPDRKKRTDQDSLYAKINYDFEHWSETKEALFSHLAPERLLVVSGHDCETDLKQIQAWIGSFLQVETSSLT